MTEITNFDKFHNLYMKFALDVADLTYCKRKLVGTVFVKDNNILAYGYNGTCNGHENVCENEDGLTKNDVIHAEANAISKIAKSTQSSEGATVYLTLSPCTTCATLLIQSGIKKVIFLEEYKDLDGIKLLEKSDIEVYKYVPWNKYKDVKPEKIKDIICVDCSGNCTLYALGGKEDFKILEKDNVEYWKYV